jgi:hypothetical protein
MAQMKDIEPGAELASTNLNLISVEVLVEVCVAEVIGQFDAQAFDGVALLVNV